METYWRWEQDPALPVGYGRQHPEPLAARTEGMAHQLRGDSIRFTVYDLTTGHPVPAGVATLLPDSSVRTAEYVVMLAPEARGRGLGAVCDEILMTRRQASSRARRPSGPDGPEAARRTVAREPSSGPRRLRTGSRRRRSRTRSPSGCPGR
ncbi:GNAT family N-acetyltransferase [Streptomyces sp. NPDC018055]|uniref:GNAT family N-acetyltransferase n=1 Tax=Streptomyces sp. NPDC018055 TaxID=3365038 RepID=UPI003790CFDC